MSKPYNQMTDSEKINQLYAWKAKAEIFEKRIDEQNELLKNRNEAVAYHENRAEKLAGALSKILLQSNMFEMEDIAKAALEEVEK